MATTKFIRVIHAPDVDQHLENLKGILENLKMENRITGYSHLASETVEEGSFKDVGREDMVIVLLTEGISGHKAKIERLLHKLKDSDDDTKIAEIIVDNIPYEPRFIAFPTDLKHIRSREDLESVFKEIGESLRDMFPKMEEPVPPPPPPPTWKKYVPYAVVALLALVGMYWVISSDIFGTTPKADFEYSVLDPIKGDLVDNADNCYIPCKVKFFDKSTDADRITWQLVDTTFIDERAPTHVYISPGKYKMGLMAINGKKSDKISRNLHVKAPPLASFEIVNNGCTAPCDIELKNNSRNAKTFNWSFVGGTSPNASDQENPGKKRYNAEGRFKVQLSVKDAAGIIADTIQEITILKNNTPFADFTFKNLTTKKPYPVNQKFRFTSTSKNVTGYRWEINKGPLLLDVKTTPNFDYIFRGYGKYSVKLIVTGGGGNDITFRNISVNNGIYLTPVKAYNSTIYKDIMKTVRVPTGTNK